MLEGMDGLSSHFCCYSQALFCCLVEMFGLAEAQRTGIYSMETNKIWTHVFVKGKSLGIIGSKYNGGADVFEAN